ncbi:alpha/beta hydrolase family protein [Flavobacterium sp. TMP13]|uniref:alpha/beta hydrolase family protein n=1 Tax=Flavobacterium sp. TMP13 TaxID=3425950 RepID=UPI003D779298
MLTNSPTYRRLYPRVLNLPPFLVLVLLFILPLVACPLWGQVVQKKELAAADYHLWSELNINKISLDGNWASYNLTYENYVDTLFVQHIKSPKKRYAFPRTESSLFTINNFFLAKRSDTLLITNLKTGEQEVIRQVKQYHYSIKNDLLIISTQTELQQNLLTIRTPSGKIEKEIKGVSTFSVSPNEQGLIFGAETNKEFLVASLNLKSPYNQKIIIQNNKNEFDGYSWQKDGKSVAFFTAAENDYIESLFYYNFKKEKLYELPSINTTLAKDSLLIHDNPQLLISDDLQRVFFNVTNKNKYLKNDSKSDVEIWNGNDQWVYTDENMHGQYEIAIKNALWIPEKNQIKQLTTDELPKISLTGDKEFAILSNPKDYEPQLEYNSPRDYYLVNLKTFEKRLFLEKLPASKGNIFTSPGGNFIAYFRDNNWWVYTIKEDRHTNITKNIDTKFTSKEELFTRESVRGNPGWTTGDNEILLYDQYDIWQVKPDGSSSRRLTHGRESKIKFSIVNIPLKLHYSSIFDDNHVESYNLKKEIYLRGDGADGKSGYFTWNSDSKEQAIIYSDSYIDQPFYSPVNHNLIFREQKFDLSPRLVTINKLGVSAPFIQSNPQQKNYFWGKAELLTYKNSVGKELKGVLIYPANYNSLEKYPMIVHIYELKSQELHHYKKPSLLNENGFNETNFNTQGYFIFLPDIIHEYQNVGNATVDCIKSGVEKVLEKNVVDPERIGLVGFSFGGYETVFTITQTGLFKTAIAGGAFTDLNSLYFTLSRGTGKPEMWRFGSTYFMLEKTPFEAPELYNASSPLFHVKKVKTPLLLWTGKNDPQVDPRQSMEFYLGLRRFGKATIMLQYPNETHVVLDPKNQIDISKRMQNWFDYYLKDMPSTWIVNGIK